MTAAWTSTIVDDVAVARVCAGDVAPLNLRERREVVRRLTAAGESARAIADRLRIAPRNVVRHRRWLREGVYR